jgi:hypothetical protein
MLGMLIFGDGVEVVELPRRRPRDSDRDCTGQSGCTRVTVKLQVSTLQQHILQHPLQCSELCNLACL